MVHKLRETFAFVYQFIKDIIRGIDEHPDGKVYRVRSRRVSHAENSVLMKLGCAILPAHKSAHQHRRSEPCTLEIFVEAS